jgi:hypothetical protein
MRDFISDYDNEITLGTHLGINSVMGSGKTYQGKLWQEDYRKDLMWITPLTRLFQEAKDSGIGNVMITNSFVQNFTESDFRSGIYDNTRFVVDEAQMLWTSASYRPEMTKAFLLLQLAKQVRYLSATPKYSAFICDWEYKEVKRPKRPLIITEVESWTDITAKAVVLKRVEAILEGDTPEGLDVFFINSKEFIKGIEEVILEKYADKWLEKFKTPLKVASFFTQDDISNNFDLDTTHRFLFTTAKAEAGVNITYGKHYTGDANVHIMPYKPYGNNKVSNPFNPIQAMQAFGRVRPNKVANTFENRVTCHLWGSFGDCQPPTDLDATTRYRIQPILSDFRRGKISLTAAESRLNKEFDILSTEISDLSREAYVGMIDTNQFEIVSEEMIKEYSIPRELDEATKIQDNYSKDVRVCGHSRSGRSLPVEFRQPISKGNSSRDREYIAATIVNANKNLEKAGFPKNFATYALIDADFNHRCFEIIRRISTTNVTHLKQLLEGDISQFKPFVDTDTLTFIGDTQGEAERRLKVLKMLYKIKGKIHRDRFVGWVKKGKNIADKIKWTFEEMDVREEETVRVEVDNPESGYFWLESMGLKTLYFQGLHLSEKYINRLGEVVVCRDDEKERVETQLRIAV